MPKRDHLVPKVISDVNGKTTTVHVKPTSGKMSERGRALSTPPPSSVSTAKPNEDVEDQDDDETEDAPKEPVIVKKFEPDVEWGNEHLNRRNLRIIDGIDQFDDDTYGQMFQAAAKSSENAEAEDYEHALAQTFSKWDKITTIDDAPTIEVPEDAYRGSKIRHALLSDMAQSPSVCRGIAAEINQRKGDPDISDVEPADVRASLELMRDATSNENLAMQTRAYSLRVHRDKLKDQIAELSRQVASTEEPLRNLVQTDTTYTLNLGDEGYASVTFTPRTALNTDRALESLSEDEKERMTVKKIDWDLLESVVGKKRAASYRDPATVAVSIK